MTSNSIARASHICGSPNEYHICERGYAVTLFTDHERAAGRGRRTLAVAQGAHGAPANWISNAVIAATNLVRALAPRWGF